MPIMAFLLVALVALCTSVSAATWQAFGGYNCNGYAGPIYLGWIGMPWKTGIDTSGKHQFFVKGCVAEVTLYEAACENVGDGGFVLETTVADNECFRVDTGHDWNCADWRCIA